MKCIMFILIISFVHTLIGNYLTLHFFLLMHIPGNFVLFCCSISHSFLKWEGWAYFKSHSNLIFIHIDAYFLVGGVKLILSSSLTTTFSNSMWIQVCEILFNFSLICLKGSEGEKCEVTSNTYFFVDANCTDDVVYVNKSEDHDYVCWFPCEGTMEVRQIPIVISHMSLYHIIIWLEKKS